MTLSPEKEKAIHEALDNAEFNAEDLSIMTIDEQVADLMDLCSDAEDMDALDVEKAVRSWREAKTGVGTVLR